MVHDSGFTPQENEDYKEEKFSKHPPDITALGNRVTEYTKLETFDKPQYCKEIEIQADEVTAVCPVTSQPDQYIVEVIYQPRKKCIESKTFKLFMQSFRNKGIFCEALASEILKEVVKYTECKNCIVTVRQKSRGGVSINSTSVVSESP